MDRILAALFLIAAAASCSTEQVHTSGDFTNIGAKPYQEAKAPSMDPARKVAQEDCREALTDAVDNLRCR